jgi:hypothetical protein
MRGRRRVMRCLAMSRAGCDGDHDEPEQHGPERQAVRPGGHPRGRGRAPAARRRRTRLTLDLDRPTLALPLLVARKWVDVSALLPPSRCIVVAQWGLASQRVRTVAAVLDDMYTTWQKSLESAG